MEIAKKVLEITNFKVMWRTFVISAVAAFLMVTLPRLGFNQLLGIQHIGIQLHDPAIKNVRVIDQILPKLKQNENNFNLKKTSVIGSKVFAESEYDKATAYVVVDLTSGEVVLGKNESKSIPIASLTKIMTAVVALDLADPKEMFTVSKKAQDFEPTKIGVVEGQKLTLEELINTAILTSANDGVEVIKEGIDNKYTKEVFIQAMNKKAEFLGLKNSYFTNPQGLDNGGNRSSADDLAVLSAYALKNYPLIKETAKKDYQFLPSDINHKQFDLYNWNGLLGVYPGVSGLKIGNTENAGYTTVVISEREGQTLAAILLGAPGVKERDLWASQLLDDGFKSAFGLEPIKVTEEQLKAKYATWKYFN